MTKQIETRNKFIDFDVDNLDTYERMVYDDLISREVEKESVLKILINSVENDFSQLSDELRELAEQNDSNALLILVDKGYKPISDLNFCTESGVEYYIGNKGNEAAISAIIHNEKLCVISKDELREMSLTAKTKGIDKVVLFTNYGVEIHSRYESAKSVGMDKITKLVS